MQSEPLWFQVSLSDYGNELIWPRLLRHTDSEKLQVSEAPYSS